MYNWLARFGYVLAAFGLALLSPLVELLPVEFLHYLAGKFAAGAKYFRAVPGSASSPSVLGFGLVLVGLVCVAIGWFFRLRGKSQ